MIILRRAILYPTPAPKGCHNYSTNEEEISR